MTFDPLVVILNVLRLNYSIALVITDVGLYALCGRRKAIVNSYKASGFFFWYSVLNGPGRSQVEHTVDLGAFCLASISLLSPITSITHPSDFHQFQAVPFLKIPHKITFLRFHIQGWVQPLFSIPERRRCEWVQLTEIPPRHSDSLISSQIPLLRSAASLSNTSNASSHTNKWARPGWIIDEL